ncbi:hypothetical protein Ait01nite_019630 [Actinoplanes italicus]|uniref:Histidine phosphatase superfamily protein (Branch 1) n=1 Tax=Actinoplanes italicus TaxID=113567 RepID=A0A2T0KPY2_9ACTN|nr:histidine phosphatase superfamily protein (branch 1) [Actinoplanes italicus]GIE28918.1 hypothetical protein Ait01nite_019630 [Actinoplanes italicus]
MHTDVVLVRHARSVPPTADGPDEVSRPLTTEGLQQALDLVTRLTEPRPAAVWSSPYRRAIQTVRPAAQALGLPLRTHGELREWDDGRICASPVWSDISFSERPGPPCLANDVTPRIGCGSGPGPALCDQCRPIIATRSFDGGRTGDDGRSRRVGHRSFRF